MKTNETNTTSKQQAQHTPEPWSAIKWTSSAETTIAKLNSDNELVTVISDCTGHGQYSDVGIANASRIVACVNALAGMEPGAVVEFIEKIKIVLHLGEHHTTYELPEALADIRTALAAMKGGAK
jgi:hypothetical protein